MPDDEASATTPSLRTTNTVCPSSSTGAEAVGLVGAGGHGEGSGGFAKFLDHEGPPLARGNA